MTQDMLAIILMVVFILFAASTVWIATTDWR